MKPLSQFLFDISSIVRWLGLATIACFMLVPQSATAQVQVLGDKPEVQDADLDAPPPSISFPTAITLGSGESSTFGPAPLASAAGHTYSYSWSCQEGSLETLTSGFDHIRYRAPLVSAQTTDLLYVWVGSSAGSTTEATITVTVLPTATGGQVTPGQISATYNSAAANFTCNYTLGSTVTRAWILASTNGTTFSIVSTIDPVTAANRSGVRTVTVAGNGSVTQVFFRLRTQIGSATAEEGAGISVGYTPLPPAPRSTEIPAAPNLIINGWQVAQPSVFLFWPRVNDSLNRDNVNYYEVQSATNPAFTGATTVNAGNNAPGQNIYESASYTVTGLADDTTWYFRVRGVNNAGTGPWSNVDSILINIQDGPVFDASNPVFPPNGATGISKTPALEVRVTDPEGDPLYTAFEISESPTGVGGWRYFGHGGDQAYLNVTRLDPSEWNPILKPNTRYYWRAIVNEQGRYLDYYGGAWPTSPVYEFTTANIGGSYTLSNVTWISGELRPNERVTYRVTVTNNGNEQSEPNYVNVFYVKNGVDKPFAYWSPGMVPALNPGQSTTTDVVAYFQDRLITGNDGTVYDNILVTGPSTLRFKSSPYALATPQATVDHQITYVNQGGPVIAWQVRGVTAAGGQLSKPAAPLGGRFRVAAQINDDIRTARVRFEYRPNGSAAWILLDDYTGGTTSYVNFPVMTHSGSTVASSQQAVEWTFPASFTLTSTLQIRMTAYDDAGATTIVTSEPLTIYDGAMSVSAGATESSSYRLGDTVRFPVTLTHASDIKITSVRVLYQYGASSEMVLDAYWTGGVVNLRTQNGGAYQVVTDPIWVGSGGMRVPPVISITLPAFVGYAHAAATLQVTVGGVVEGYSSRSVVDTTDGTFAVGTPDLPAPFHNFISFVTAQDPSWPAGAYGKSTSLAGTAIDWEGDTVVHGLVHQNYSYLLNDANLNPVSYSGGQDFYARYDRQTGNLVQTLLPGTYQYDDLKVIGSTAYLILRNGTAVSYAAMTGTSMGAAQPVLTMVTTVENSTAPEFVKLGGELFVGSSTRNDIGGGGFSTWRNRLQRVLPSAQAFIEHPAYYGRHLDYGTHLNTPEGIFVMNASRNVVSQLASWPYNANLFFSSANSSYVGARWAGENGGIVDWYSSAGVPTRWDVKAQTLKVHAFQDAFIGVGQGTSASLAGENGKRLILRKMLSNGIEDRIAFDDGYFDSWSMRLSAISPGKWVAVSTGNKLAIGNMSGDITAPAVQITTADSSYVTGQAKSLTWTMSDNLNQLASLKVLKIVGGVTTQIANYTSGTLPTSLNHTFTDTAASLIVRVEAYDQSGNRGVAEKVLMRSSTFTFSSFTAASYSVVMGTAAQLNWTVSAPDAFRVYNILTRPQGGTAWTTAGSVTGSAFLLDTSLLSGAVEVRVESGGVTRDLPQVLTITGNRFAFDNAGFAPAAGTVYVASTNPVLRLNWASNQAESPAVLYTVLGRFATSGPGSTFGILGSTTAKTLEVNTGSNALLEWRVVALWEGLEFVSGSRTVSIAQVAAPAAPTVTAGGRDTVAPQVDISWSAVAGVNGYVLYRRNLNTDTMEELARVPGTSYRDEAVTWGDSFAYSIATVLGDEISLPGGAASVTLTPLLPLGITFVNANYQIVPGNANTAQWNPVLPAGVTAVFEDYQVYLRRGDGSIVASEAVTPAAGTAAQVSYAGLEYNQSYVVEVFALHPNGTRLSTDPVRLHFSTGFDVRGVSAPVVATPTKDDYGVNLTWAAGANADYYDIFRSTDGGALAWAGRSFAEGFSDGGAPPGASVAYVIRARNDNTYADSAQTPAVTFSTTYQAWLSSYSLSGTNAEPTAIPFHDGVANLLKYAFNLSPTQSNPPDLLPGTGIAGLPDIRLATDVGAQEVLRYEYLLRRGNVLIYTPQKSFGLTGDWVDLTSPPIMTRINSEWDRVVHEEPLTGPAAQRQFGRITVSLPN